MHLPRSIRVNDIDSRRVVELAIDRMWQSPATFGAILFEAAMTLLALSVIASGVLAYLFHVGWITTTGLIGFGLILLGIVAWRQHRRRAEYIGYALRELGL